MDVIVIGLMVKPEMAKKH